MKRILGLSIAALLITGLVVGGTMAYFSDTETSTGNTFTAGTLNLTVDGNDGSNTLKFTVTNANPGEGSFGIWTLVNTGNLPGYVDFSSIAVTNAEHYNLATDEAEEYDATTNPGGDSDTSDATGVGELAANLDVVLFVDDGAGGGTANNGAQDGTEATVYSGKLGSIAASYDQDLPLSNGATTYLSMTWSVATSVGNLIMGDGCTLGMTVELDQTAD
ncbi:MAG: CalY family protein [Dehalococcoidia bacterium]|jgi:predicted ribosomally synthesized peptide with SipW-like signal peptide|nr:CalY family protein [Dehalococcoidia bacterium]